MNLGERLKSIRAKAAMSQEELARRLDMDRASLSLIENDKRSLKAEELIALSKILNVSVDQLLGIESLPEIIMGEEPIASKKPDIRINVPAKNRRKFKEVLLYLLNRIGAKPHVGESVLYKLFYFIDFNYYEKYEEQLIGAVYIKNHHGPTPIEFQEIVQEMIQDTELELVKSKYFQYTQKKYLPHREPDLAQLTANEIKLIDEVLDKFGNMNAVAISDYSHQDVPWIVTPAGKKIDYEAVFYRTPTHSVRAYDDGLSEDLSD